MPKFNQPWVITGVAGFLGSHVLEQLLNQQIPVIGIDNFFAGNPNYLDAYHNNPYFEFVEADIRDVKKLEKIFALHQPFAVIHLAALHFIPAAIADPALAVSINVHGTQSVLTAFKKSQAQVFWFASTGDVYAPSTEAHREDSKIEPFNIYGLTKLMGEQLIQLESRQYQQGKFVIGRLFNLYGMRETNPHILPEIIQQLKHRPEQPLRLGNLFPKRDLVPIEDAARAVIELVKQAAAGITVVNVASGVSLSMSEVIAEIGDIRGKAIVVEQDAEKIRPVEREHLQANVEMLNQLIGWSPNPALKDGLTQLLMAEELI
jgi:UDP-glucose 4-epimerase